MYVETKVNIYNYGGLFGGVPLYYMYNVCNAQLTCKNMRRYAHGLNLFSQGSSSEDGATCDDK